MALHVAHVVAGSLRQHDDLVLLSRSCDALHLGGDRDISGRSRLVGVSRHWHDVARIVRVGLPAAANDQALRKRRLMMKFNSARLQAKGVERGVALDSD